MNCVNHPETEVSAFCQNCGKALCAQCVRPVAGVIYCEPCLAAKLSGARPVPPGATGWSPVDAPGAFAAAARGVAAGPANPVLAAFLGLIPGVGAMYNGQFIKALIHVLVFVVLIGITDHFGPAGLLIAAWIFYQVFDAAQTATARRDGLPIPDPIGLNAFVERLGIPGQPVPVAGTAAQAGVRTGASPAGYSTAPPAGYSTVPPAGYSTVPPAEPWAGTAASGSPFGDPVPPPAAGAPWQAFDPAVGSGAPFVPVPPPYIPRPDATGPIVLIVVGMLFLFTTLGVFHMYWLRHSWPVLIIVLGAVLLFRRVRSVPPVTPPSGGAL